MKIGFYSPYLDTFGGGERYMLTLASHLSRRHDVDVFWDDLSIKAPLSRFLKIDLSNTNFTKNIFKYSLKDRIINSRKYGLIFILSDGSIPTTFAHKNILHFQVPFTFNKPSLTSKIKLKKYNWVISNSLFTKKHVDKSFGVNSQVIYPPVDVQSIIPGDKKEIILSVGRFSNDQLHPKKQEILIDVFKEIYKKEPGWKLYLVGQAKKKDQAYIRKLKNLSRGFAIKIFENLNVDRLRNLYAKSLIYWHATGFGEDEEKFPEKMEHFGISTVEASAAGVVPIVINKGGQKEIVSENINGMLWETKTQLFDKTLKLISNKSEMIKLSHEAVKNSKRFSVDRFIKEYEKNIFS